MSPRSISSSWRTKSIRTIPGKASRHAVCALDGSWVTDFEYSNIFFADNVVLAVRNNEKNDVDVLDYNGKLLYNSTVLGCYSQIASNSAYTFISGYGDGLMAVPLTNGKTAYIDAPTGTVHYAPYPLGESFFGGYARVRLKETGLYGYMNRDFTMVIQPQFLFARLSSAGGKAVVQLQDNSYAVIDQTGKTLFKSPNTIGRMDSSILRRVRQRRHSPVLRLKFEGNRRGRHAAQAA